MIVVVAVELDVVRRRLEERFRTMRGVEGDDPVPARARARRRRPVLEVDGLSKQYGATTALRDVSIALHEREVLALLGDNGAASRR